MCYTKYFSTRPINFDWIEEDISCVNILTRIVTDSIHTIMPGMIVCIVCSIMCNTLSIIT